MKSPRGLAISHSQIKQNNSKMFVKEKSQKGSKSATFQPSKLSYAISDVAPVVYETENWGTTNIVGGQSGVFIMGNYFLHVKCGYQAIGEKRRE